MEPLDPAVVTELARRAKVELRKRARAVRKTTARSALLARSEAIVARLLELPVMAGAARVALFDAIEARGEISLAALDRVLRARGASVAYPAIDPETRRMVFRDPGDPARLEELGMGFREPAPELDEQTELDVMIVPALRVDSRGFRLGYGGGFYDRTLPRFCPPATSVAVVYEFELAPELPTTEGDVQCQWVVTDKQAFEVG